jgi:hypothetical protein
MVTSVAKAADADDRRAAIAAPMANLLMFLLLFWT